MEQIFIKVIRIIVLLCNYIVLVILLCCINYEIDYVNIGFLAQIKESERVHGTHCKPSLQYYDSITWTVLQATNTLFAKTLYTGGL